MLCDCSLGYRDGAYIGAETLCMGPSVNGEHLCYPTPCVNTTRCKEPDLHTGEIIAIVGGSGLLIMFIVMCILEGIRQSRLPPEVPEAPEVQVVMVEEKT